MYEVIDELFALTQDSLGNMPMNVLNDFMVLEQTLW